MTAERQIVPRKVIAPRWVITSQVGFVWKFFDEPRMHTNGARIPDGFVSQISRTLNSALRNSALFEPRTSDFFRRSDFGLRAFPGCLAFMAGATDEPLLETVLRRIPRSKACQNRSCLSSQSTS